VAQTEKESDVGTTSMNIKQNDILIVLRPDEADGFEIFQTIVSPITEDKTKLFELSMVGIMMHSVLEFLADREELIEEYQRFLFENASGNVMAVKEQLDMDDLDFEQFNLPSAKSKYH